MSDTLVKTIKIAMQPLATQFGLRVIREDDGTRYAAVVYANATTGLKVAVDWIELRPFLSIYELQNGKIVHEIPSLDPRPEHSKGFDVDSLLLLRPVANSPVGKMFSGNNEAVADLLKQYAVALASQASDVLTGHFEIFQQLDEIVRDRAHALEEAKRDPPFRSHM